jgi:hypothetical protein
VNSQITASIAAQHCAEMNRRSEAARRVKQARAARPAARKVEAVHQAPTLIGRLVAARKRTAVPVIARPQAV